ncbi:MAG TPA: tetratricopeptide repeat protein, partial [Hellea balneolensis]|nr:tetratricopeptide repeat protein [Hellea balneolensis]
MVDFINEVEEELRKDKYNALLRKFGPYIMAILVAIVLLAGFIEYQKGKDGREARAASASYVSATKLADAGKTQQALQKFIALSKVAPPGYAGLSLSRAADLELKRGNKEMAVKYFDQAAARFEQPIHKDMAAYKAALIVMDLGR